MSRDDIDGSVPWWGWLIAATAIILTMASIDDQPNSEPYVNVCNRPTVQQAC